MTIFAFGGLAAGATPADAQCGGRGSYGSGCEMMMGVIQMPAKRAPATIITGVNM